MVHHIVMWKFRPEVQEEDKANIKRDMEQALTALVGVVPGLLSLAFIAEPIESSTHDMALVSTLEKEEDIAIYSNHPSHVKAANTYIRPYVYERACLDYK